MFIPQSLIDAFAIHRNTSLSFPFLKENGELLSIVASRGMLVDHGALQIYQDIYDKSVDLIEFFPQYYRFILAIILDLEDLGISGSKGRQICEYIQSENLVQFDTADTRRLESLTLLLRRIDINLANFDLLEKTHLNLQQFLRDPRKFLRYNKPLFYEFTHLVFYLTKYGNEHSPIDADILSFVLHGGRLAYLDQDADLLAEFCVCLQYLNSAVPKPWIELLENTLSQIDIIYDRDVASALNPAVDDYHPYLVINWALSFENKDEFSRRFEPGTPRFKMAYPDSTALSVWSDYLFQFEVEGKILPDSSNWAKDVLSENQIKWLEAGLAADPGMAETIYGFSNGSISF